MTMPTYAVTGASGHLGRLVVGELLARGVPASNVVALVRTWGNAADLAERGVQVREADYSRPLTLGAALAGVDRLLLVSSSEAGQRAAHHSNVIEAAKTAGTSRIVYTSMLNADDSTNPLAGEHRDSERALRDAGVAFTLLRNGWYTENYTDQLAQYLQRGEITGAAASGRICAATRHDYAAAAAAALLQDEEGERTYELGGPAFDLPELARIISEVTGTPVTYRDLPAQEYASFGCRKAASTRRAPTSSPPSTHPSPTATSRPTAGTWRGCWAAPPRPSSPTSYERREALTSATGFGPAWPPSDSSAPATSAAPWPGWRSTPATTSW